MRTVYKKWIPCLLLLAVTLCACASETPRVEYNGKELSAEEIFSLADHFPREAETETETLFEIESEETVAPTDGIVYFTDGGTVWHEWSTCGHLSQKGEVKSGSIEDAIEAGKERGCSFCAKGEDVT